ncbi:hypothetical protein CA51_29260 [Rosistilla oblonga]|uniref:Uncharacterized protein n=1 Tax=Rosistilla oblonga TaxID=2527990 RepID=A0A518J0C5_9BACT|nr:hypothetical protein [Rosistilla oblonga]QDV13040.1 hypothetical protein CA51_29260 [Rosistilla oblonga]QDV58791.1 hypothetical protein Mal33_48160 [Rosistilla oblonga]
MKFQTGIVVGGLIAALLLTNPSKEDHVRKLAAERLAPYTEEGSDSPLVRIGSAFAESFSDSVIDYHNYWLFSTTTSLDSDQRLTLGFLRFVHVEKRTD